MARNHSLAKFVQPTTEEHQRSADTRADYTRRGASRSMMQSLDELAESSIRLLEGETVVALDPELLEGSFVADRIGDDQEDYIQLRDAIRQSGQSTPILVRPHPDVEGRYMIVFGHRRARAARDLQIPVRAVIKPLEDIAHVIAQGQENTARSDLTFIEKALFAKKLVANGLSKDVVKVALTIDDTLLSRMLAVAETVPEKVLDAVGAAKGVGRDRWEELKKLVQIPTNAERACAFILTDDFGQTAEAERFNSLLSELKAAKKTTKKQPASPSVRQFDVAAKSVAVTTKSAGKTFTIALTSKDASKFGAFLSDQLESLYQTFQREVQTKSGD
ncbi:plasmid partitioning protein RepB (plasmid) [Agrobacterium salinitolerans]|uniref:Plasmid partitioning protein RepB n=1 Tax=Agrobacterium salinitolerans TaxID=1183413 RepID=A0A4Z1QTB8_9HYPH|nr:MULTISPECIES: plasmid partitioning protein RepB [Agrobacterium]MDH6297824.1 ParB family chromosome partitioning protein [Agrobacterium fabrum]UYZ10971.1 plasmid partitioning protein RepB [Agrobacterium salinitolerans]